MIIFDTVFSYAGNHFLDFIAGFVVLASSIMILRFAIGFVKH